MAKKKGVESLSYPIVKHSFERFGGWYYKIPDPPRGGFQEGNRFTSKRPFDIMTITKGVNYSIEMKGFREIKGISVNQLSEHQKENLDTIFENSADDYHIPMVGVYFYRSRELKKIVFVRWEHLKRVGLISKQFLLNWLAKDINRGKVFSEVVTNPKTGKSSRKSFFPLEKLTDNYLIDLTKDLN